jgi:two-component system, NtrC family, nitrogen regulation response regulator NtrX
MPSIDPAVDTILIVDDEESVRKTFREWLEGAGLGCRLLTAEDAEAALVLANQQTIDLAILDWNLGAGNDGLRLLEDLYLFNPDVIAIMVTGFAHQATPLDALRMGIRDYLDKNQDLSRETFLAAVERQLERLRPLKRERRLHASLAAFREAVEKILPLVQSAAALNDPVPLPDAVRHLLQFLLRTTGARDGALLVHGGGAAPAADQTCRAYDTQGRLLDQKLAPFARSVAGTVVSLQEPYSVSRLGEARADRNNPGHTWIELQPFEQGRQSLLAAPMNVGSGWQVVLELFDKDDGSGRVIPFTTGDRQLIAAAADFGSEMLRQALAERQMHRLLFDAVEAALGASASVAEVLRSKSSRRAEEPPPQAVLDRLRESLTHTAGETMDARQTVRLAEAVRVLALRHGPAAVDHCIRLVESVRALLDSATGAEETRP